MRSRLIALCAIILAAGPLAAQEAAREWPSHAIDVDDEGEDLAMGRGGRCRLDGERIEQGVTACVDFGEGAQPALCGMSLNVTSWLPQDGSCAP